MESIECVRTQKSCHDESDRVEHEPEHGHERDPDVPLVLECSVGDVDAQPDECEKGLGAPEEDVERGRAVLVVPAMDVDPPRTLARHAHHPVPERVPDPLLIQLPLVPEWRLCCIIARPQVSSGKC